MPTMIAVTTAISTAQMMMVAIFCESHAIMVYLLLQMITVQAEVE